MTRPLFIAPPRRRARPAAGILLRHTDPDGVQWWLLGRRCRRLGGTWANIGGSLERGEQPLAGAAREFWEEVAVPTAALIGSTIVTVVDCSTDRRDYTLFVAETPYCFDDAELGWENDELAWFPTAEVTALDLHTAFARGWVQLLVDGIARPARPHHMETR